MVYVPLKFMINGTIVNFPFLDCDPRMELIRFAIASSNVSDFHCRNNALTAKLLRQGYRYHTLRKAFSKFYYRPSVSLRKLLQQEILEPEFYGDLVYRIKNLWGNLILWNNLENF